MNPCPSPASRLLAKPRTTKYGVTATTIATNSVSNGNIQLTASERPSGCSDESDFCYAKRFADHDFLTISAQTAVAKPESVCVTNVEGSVIGELLRTVLCRR